MATNTLHNALCITQNLFKNHAKRALLREGACTGPLQQPNTRFLAPTRDHNPSGISIGSAVFAGLTARDQQTDTQTTEQQVSK